MDVKDQLSSLYTDWILGFMVVNFDLEYGQSKQRPDITSNTSQEMEHMFPEIPLGETDLTNMLVPSFVDEYC